MRELQPSRQKFCELASRHPIVPVWRTVLADAQTPVAAFLRLEATLSNAFLLESVEGGERWGRYSFIGGDAFAVIKAVGGRVVVEGTPPVRPEAHEPPLAYMRLCCWHAGRRSWKACRRYTAGP